MWYTAESDSNSSNLNPAFLSAGSFTKHPQLHNTKDERPSSTQRGKTLLGRLVPANPNFRMPPRLERANACVEADGGGHHSILLHFRWSRASFRFPVLFMHEQTHKITTKPGAEMGEVGATETQGQAGIPTNPRTSIMEEKVWTASSHSLALSLPKPETHTHS